VWLLTVNASLGVERAVALQTNGLGLGLSAGDSFGAAVAVLSSVEAEDYEPCSTASGWDWDRNCATLDLAVGAPFMDGVSGDSDFANTGVVFIFTVQASTGVVVRHYAIKSFDGVPYYSGGTVYTTKDKSGSMKTINHV